MIKITKIKKYVLRLCLFLPAYFSISYFYPQLTFFFHSYKFSANDSLLIYVLPFLLFLLFIFKSGDMAHIKEEKNDSRWRLLFLATSLIIFYIPFIKLFLKSGTDGNIGTHPFIIAVYYAQILFANFFLFISVFGLKFVKKLKGEVILLFSTLLLYMGAQFLIEYNWKFFSSIILSVLKFILPWINNSASVTMDNFSMKLNGFNIFVGPPCAGIYSMATFIFFFIFAILLVARKSKLDWTKTLLALLGGLLIIFSFNIVRILIIFLVGAYWSRTLAIELFHEYLSGVFLLSIFLVFLYKVLPHIVYRKK